MNAEAGQAWFRIAVFFTLVSGGLALFTQPGTAEFAMSVASLCVGLTFTAIVVYLVRRANR
jgi:hypothetical protein